METLIISEDPMSFYKVHAFYGESRVCIKVLPWLLSNVLSVTQWNSESCNSGYPATVPANTLTE